MPGYVSLPEAARRTRQGYGRVYHALLSGAVPAERDGRGWLIHESDLPALAAAAAAIPVRTRCVAA